MTRDVPINKGRYRVEAVLSRGGAGTTYRASDLFVPGAISCVIKQLDQQADAEAGALSAVAGGGTSRAYLPDIYDHLRDERCLVMTFVDGKDLQEACRSGPMSVEQVIAALIHVCDALVYLHSHQIVHRDIKPANLVMDGYGHTWLVDFGQARLLTSPTPERRAWTPGFAPSEQLDGRSNLRSDCYALAMTAAVLLTGEFPTADGQGQHHLELLRRMTPPVDADLLAILAAALAGDIRDRPTAQEMLQVLKVIGARLLPARQAVADIQDELHRVRTLLDSGSYEAARIHITQHGNRLSASQVVADELLANLGEALQHPGVSRTDQACLYAARAELLWQLGKHDEARGMCLLGIKRLPPSNPPALCAALYNRLGAVYGNTGSLNQAMVAFHVALAWSQIARAPLLESQILNNIGRFSAASGDKRQWSRAQHYYTQSLLLKLQQHDLVGSAESLLGFGLEMQSAGNAELAKACFQRARDFSKQVGRDDLIAGAWVNLGLLLFEQRDLHTAEEFLLAARALYQEREQHYAAVDREQALQCDYSLGELALARGAVEEAASYANQARHALVGYEDSMQAWLARTQAVLAKVHAARGDHQQALDSIAPFFEEGMFDQLEPIDQAFLHHAAMVVAFARQEREKALEHARTGLDLARSIHVLWLQDRFAEVM
ncbi:MAG: hypothetical protein OHK0022_26300 [Roseiflexaceae bacterium]